MRVVAGVEPERRSLQEQAEGADPIPTLNRSSRFGEIPR
jgi:hypothetical protein